MTDSHTRYPLLTQILAIKNLPLQPMYSTGGVAKIFEVSARAIQNRVASGQMPARDLPGRMRFLPDDLEAYLANSKRRPFQRAV
jgi:hypothetical protein